MRNSASDSDSKSDAQYSGQESGITSPAKTPRNTGSGSTEIPIFDLAGSLERLSGDQELFSDLVQFFYEDAPILLEQVYSGIQEHAAPKIERAAHSLKGLAANFGAAPTTIAARILEQMSHSASPEEVRAALKTLEIEVERLIRALSPFRKA